MVGTDYIIMEEVPGVRLGDRWTEFKSASDVTPVMTGTLDVEAKFGSLRFLALEASISKKTSAQTFKLYPSSSVQSIPPLGSCQRVH